MLVHSAQYFVPLPLHVTINKDRTGLNFRGLVWEGDDGIKSMKFVLYVYMWFLQEGGLDIGGASTCRSLTNGILHNSMCVFCGLGVAAFLCLFCVGWRLQRSSVYLCGLVKRHFFSSIFL